MSGLRAIKLAAGGGLNEQLNQSVGTGDAAENAQNWFKQDTNENAINTALTAITADQMELLTEFETAHRNDATTGKGLA